MRRNLLSLLLLLVGSLAGCASRPGPEVLNDVTAAAPAGAKVTTILVATTRDRSEQTGLFTNDRADRTNFAEFTISIPPDHKVGQIEWPKGPPSPQRSFATLRRRALSHAEFRARIAPGRQNREIAAFVHGFNVTFQEALFQTAQMSVDADIKGLTVLFAWPSAGSVMDYVGDKDAVTASRDGLVEVLGMIGRDRGPGETNVLAHSMGGWLTMESLRQLRLTGRQDTLDKLQVTLADPDVDVDVFRSQLDVIGPMNRPLTVLVAPDDRALKVSALLAGSRQRAGAIDVNNSRVAEASRRSGVRVIDISAVSSTDQFKHSRFTQLASGLAKDANRPSGRQAGVFVLNSVGDALSSPFRVVGQALSQ